MSRGQFNPQNSSDGVLGRCQNKRSTDKILKVFDVDKGEIEYVNVGVPMSSHQGSRCCTEAKPNEASSSNCVIMINDEDSTDACRSEKITETESSSSYLFDDDDECMMFDDKNETSNCSKKAQNFSQGSCSRNMFDFFNSFGQFLTKDFSVMDEFDDPGEAGSSETPEASKSDSSDCEILDDPSGKIREEWEKAALKRKTHDRHQTAGNHAKTSELDAECRSSFCETSEKMNHHFHVNEESEAGLPSSHKGTDISCPDALAEQSPLERELHTDEHLNNAAGESSFYHDESTNKMKKQVPAQSMHNIPTDDVTSSGQGNCPLFVCTISVQQQNPLVDVISQSPFDYKNLYKEPSSQCPLFTSIDSFSQNQSYLIGEREKHKESDEYKRAEEEEWASRQEQLRIQAEEAQRLRRRKRAETLRLLDVERRQKQRLEEVRETQKKDEETINLKERLRCEVRRELEKIELMYRDMASLLRGLGISVSGGRFPSTNEVNAAYKKALMRFHPDRASKTDIRQQVDAEEKFKLISRLKEKLLPAAY